MIEKFDLTNCIDLGGNYSHEDIQEIEKLQLLISQDFMNIDLHLKKARIFASCYDTVYTIISYCRIIKYFTNNLIAYIELGEYLKNYSYYDWSIITCQEGLKYHKDDEQLKSILKDATEYSQN